MLTVYQVFNPSKKYCLDSLISIKSPSPRSPKSKRGISPRSKTFKEVKKSTFKAKLLKRKSKTINEVKEKPNFLEKTLKNPSVVEKIDQMFSKSQSHEYFGDQVSFSMPSSNRSNRESDYNIDFQGEEDQDLVDERGLEFLNYNKFFLTIKNPCKNYKEFENQNIVKFLKETQIIFGIMLCFYTFESVIDFLLHMNDLNETNSVRGIMKFILNISLFFLSFFGIEKFFYFFFMRVVFLILVIAIFILQMVDLHYETDHIMMDIDFALMFCPLIFLTNFSFFTFLEILFINLLFLIAFMVVIGYMHIFQLENLLMTILILFHNVIKNFFQLRFQMKSFNNLKSSRLKRAEQEEKISQLLPIHVIFFSYNFHKIFK